MTTPGFDGMIRTYSRSFAAYVDDVSICMIVWLLSRMRIRNIISLFLSLSLDRPPSPTPVCRPSDVLRRVASAASCCQKSIVDRLVRVFSRTRGLSRRAEEENVSTKASENGKDIPWSAISSLSRSEGGGQNDGQAGTRYVPLTNLASGVTRSSYSCEPCGSVEENERGTLHKPAIVLRCARLLDWHATCRAQSYAWPPVRRTSVGARKQRRGLTASRRCFSSLGILSRGVMSPTDIDAG